MERAADGRVSLNHRLPNGTNSSCQPNPLLVEPFKDLPVLGFINQNGDLRAKQPFRAVAVVALLHLFQNLIATVRTWIDLGCTPSNVYVFYKLNYGYDTDDSIKGALLALGVNVQPVSALDDRFLNELEIHLAGRSLRLIVCEDGGIATPKILERAALLELCVGFVEQTSKGLWRTKEITNSPSRPYLALPLSEFKQRFEPPHVARAFVRTLDTFLAGYRDLSDMHIAVLGCAGCIGSHIADLLLDYTPNVTVFDKNLPRLYRLLKREFKIADSVNDAVAEKDAVIGCTGSCAIGLNEISRVNDGCVAASASSEQVEIDVQGLERLKETSDLFVPPGLPRLDCNSRGTVYRLRPYGKRVVLLNNGFPLNFAYGANLNPFPFDLVMALLLAGTIELAIGKYDGQVGFLNVFDDIESRYQLTETYVHAHRNR